MELASKYNPSDIEDKWYQYWLEHNMFHSEPDNREPYTVVIPPPNVTGVLHMGHMLNNTIQDILVRRARMLGKNACWVPGTDHASIATEAKVVAKLAAEGIGKNDLSREKFLEHAWEWTHLHGGIILKQLRKLGASCDWDRTAFTMDEKRSESVYKVFVDLYKKGLIYRGVRMVNWDPSAKTAISDEEVIHKEEHGKLYYLRYKIAPLTPQGGESELPKYQTAKRENYALLKEHAKDMRKFSTEAESALWEMLRKKQLGDKFRKQHIIENFIVDFVCLDKKLVIEVDGKYHNQPEIEEADKQRDEILQDFGYTVLRFTNEEVIANTESVLEKIKTELDNSSPYGGVEGAYCVVATTRPETIFGDVAVCINPNDPKTAWLKGKKVIVPIANRVVPIIEDDYVDMEFGTGCLKVTPAHDVNDYMLGEKYNLEAIDIFNDDGTLNEHGLMYQGMDRFDVRKKIEGDLESAGLMEKVEAYTNKVGFSERTHVAIEPKLSMQWFLKMQGLAKPALENVENDTIKFYPARYKNTYRYWMENIKDWNISRQLWWGHRIPAYYIDAPLSPPEGGNWGFVVAENEEKARELAIAKHPSLGGAAGGFSLRQDEDCLDTWFSSWLWPISVFDGINHPDNEEINYYYPTSDLVTGPDIIFFWVARMIMAGYEYRKEPCFHNVYFTGIVRDKQGRKMSKSLGNSPDPIELMEKYGADAVRMGLLLTAPAGNDIPFDEVLCEQGRNFNNKIWNAFRLVKGWEVSDAIEQPESAKAAIEWFENILAKTAAEMDDLFSKYRLSEALMMVYKLFWDEFSSWYLEMVKPAYQQPIDAKTYEATLGFFDSLLRLLHPFMPFITEELWQALAGRKAGESIMLAPMPELKKPSEALLQAFEQVKEIISNIRTIRLEKNIPNKEELSLEVLGGYTCTYDSVIEKMANLTEIKLVEEKDPMAASFLVGTTEYAVPLGNNIDVEAELEKLQAELTYLEGFLVSVEKKLGNERFVANAKPEIVENERKKKADAESKIATIKETIASLTK
ncbi:valine--tRNA ligase [Dysgonomonas sp. 25]|uniref:valine--tRNA ligase n=1 Tax=Dysgonomonas sp. 25 TaxID=2302933 RepID=UPI0013D3B57E|nr:valine--tRNA ligase [Dysgonomonas sp. 25]NDV69323.1 valine--tRNA ligase [Dysgonomonas sp. 25]